MARVQNTLIGRASGSVGMVVFLTWRLLNVTRSKPISVANPNTVPQQWQRNRFAQTVELYNLLKPFIEIGYKNRNRKMTLFNAFQHWNQQQMFVNDLSGLVLFQPEFLKISRGLLQICPINRIQSFDSSFTTNVRIFKTIPIVSDYRYRWYVVVFNENSQIWVLKDYGLFTSPANTQISANIGMPERPDIGDTVHAWSFIHDELLDKVTDTSYLNTVTVS